MKVEISIDRSCICEKSTLGTQQENKFEKLEFTFPEEIKDYAKTIEFQTPESKFIDKIENNEYIIKNNISKYECVQVQIVAIKDDTVFKSKIFDLYFYKSINATEETAEEQSDLIHKMILDIENIKGDISNFSSYDDTEIKEDLKNKVNKIEGKGLSTNDYTNEEKRKLEELNNYDDTELRKKLEEAEKEKELLKKDLLANQITDKVEGKSLTLTDCSSARLVEFEIEGNSYQKTRSGKNKLFLEKKETGTKNGVDYTIDGTKITLNGITTATTDIYFLGNWGNTSQNENRLLKAGIYTLSCNTTNNNRFSANMYYNTMNIISLAYKDIQTQNISENTYYSVFYISIPSKKTFNNETFEFQLEENSTATDYEPYGASPSPDYPSKIKSCGESGNITIIKSKNTDNTATNYQEQIYAIPIQKSFRAIEDVRDRFIKQDGKWYEEHNINEVIVNSLEGLQSIRQNNKTVTVWLDVLMNGKKVDRIKIKCDKFKAVYQDSIVDEEFCRNASISYPNRFLFNVYKTRLNSASSEGLLSYLQSNTITVEYELETPELIECTQKQTAILNELSNSENYKGITYIFSTDEVQPQLKATYSKDLQIENKRLEDRISAIEELLKTPSTSALLLDNIENDLEKEIEEI